MTHPLHDWCTAVLGACQGFPDAQRFHGRSSVCKLVTGEGVRYLKVHHHRTGWEHEVHAYEQWTRAFGDAAPKLIAVHGDEPFALVVSELPGTPAGTVEWQPAQAERLWQSAGAALAKLHASARGHEFGFCRRDGSVEVPGMTDPVEFVAREFDQASAFCHAEGLLAGEEQDLVATCRARIEVFTGERPMPCHRDFGPANWIVSPAGEWVGVIDFEMSAWSVRVSDFTRYPNWEWLRQPRLIDAFFEGYGRRLTDRELEQACIAHVVYALGAIQWGTQHNHPGFVAEGHVALAEIEQYEV